MESENVFQGEKYTFQSVIDLLPIAVVITSPDLTIRYVNPAFSQLTGFSLEDVAGSQAPYPWWPPVYHKEYRQELSAVKQGQKHKTDWLFAGKDGHLFWIKVSVTPLVKDNQVQYLLACWTDITTNKTIETALKNELDLLKARHSAFRLA